MFHRIGAAGAVLHRMDWDNAAALMRKALGWTALAGTAFLLCKAQVVPMLAPFAMAFLAAALLMGRNIAALLTGCVAGALGATLSDFNLRLPVGAAVVLIGGICRDLLLLKTAPKTGAGMLSGVCTDSELRELLPRFSAGELLRHTRLLQDTASGFNRSANRRIDVELCLLQMCEPALDLDAEAMNARLSRLEAALDAGFVPAPQPAAAKAEESVPERKPAAEEPAQEKAPEPAAEELPVTFWADLVNAVRRWRPSLGGYFNTNDANLIVPVLRGDLLELSAAGEIVRSIVDKEDIRGFVAQQASALLHKPLRVRILLRGEGTDREKGIRELMAMKERYPDLIHTDE